ncbi:MAG: hypothetical protein WCP89_01990 [archaeon]
MENKIKYIGAGLVGFLAGAVLGGAILGFKNYGLEVRISHVNNANDSYVCKKGFAHWDVISGDRRAFNNGDLDVGNTREMIYCAAVFGIMGCAVGLSLQERVIEDKVISDRNEPWQTT